METTEMRISIKEFKETLSGFTGTENYYPHRIPNGMSCRLTDGAQFVRELGSAYWLFNIILSWQIKLQAYPFQIWKVMRQGDGSWFITCSDGNDHLLGCQESEPADFPIDQIDIWLVDGVCMLPSEY
jgi:hypothetical protein